MAGRQLPGGPDARGQAHTLEAIVAAMVLLSGLIFALQVTAVTPLAGSTSSQHIENQQGAVAEGILANAASNGSLTRTLLYWNATEEEFIGSEGGAYTHGGPPTDLGRLLNASLDDRGIAFNLYAVSVTADGTRQRQQIVYMGESTDHASVASRTVTLYDDDPLYEPDSDPDDPTAVPSDRTVGSSQFYASDRAPNERLYNVLEVNLVLWRM